nr:MULTISPECIES: hypothetical protein [Gammaproteobacteria]
MLHQSFSGHKAFLPEQGDDHFMASALWDLLLFMHKLCRFVNVHKF